MNILRYRRPEDTELLVLLDSCYNQVQGRVTYQDPDVGETERMFHQSDLVRRNVFSLLQITLTVYITKYNIQEHPEVYLKLVSDLLHETPAAGAWENVRYFLKCFLFII